jgi:plastocyanin
MVASVLALTLAACSSTTQAGAPSPSSPAASTPVGTPTSSAASTPVATPSASASAPASAGPGGSGTASEGIQLSAQGIKYSTDQLRAPAGRAFTIEFKNNDSGIPHNVDILDASGTSIFKGAVFSGVASQTYQVPALKAGTYSFICDVHPNVMTGTLTVG